jgi:hypothetical protein
MPDRNQDEQRLRHHHFSEHDNAEFEARREGYRQFVSRGGKQWPLAVRQLWQGNFRLPTFPTDPELLPQLVRMFWAQRGIGCRWIIDPPTWSGR